MKMWYVRSEDITPLWAKSFRPAQISTGSKHPTVYTLNLHIREGVHQMAKKIVYIAFDYDDLDVKQNLIAESKRPECPWEFVDYSIRQAIQGPWVTEAKRLIASSDCVIVLCGEQTRQAAGVAIELQAAQEIGKHYFLLSGTRKGRPTKPAHARDDDKIWTYKWPTVETLLKKETPPPDASVK
jgi:hypothetical protein